MGLKPILILFFFLLSLVASAQHNCQCEAFSEGCWTLIGASNGVELYVTHKKHARPNLADKGFNITVYAKIVNTNDYPVESGLGVATTFYYYDIDKNVMTPKQISMDKVLGNRQTIVRSLEIFTSSSDISYGQIQAFLYAKKQ
jgi:hypothetical protein